MPKDSDGSDGGGGCCCGNVASDWAGSAVSHVGHMKLGSKVSKPRSSIEGDQPPRSPKLDGIGMSRISFCGGIDISMSRKSSLSMCSGLLSFTRVDVELPSPPLFCS